MLDSETRADGNTSAERVLYLFFTRLDTYGRELAGGKASTDKAQVTPALIQTHLDGQLRIGAHSTSLDGERMLTIWSCESCQVVAVTSDAIRLPPTNWVKRAEQ